METAITNRIPQRPVSRFFSTLRSKLLDEGYVCRNCDKGLGIAVVLQSSLRSCEEKLLSHTAFRRIMEWNPDLQDTFVYTTKVEYFRQLQDLQTQFQLPSSFVHQLRKPFPLKGGYSLPKFYALVKLHKTHWKGRGIFAAPSWITTRLSIQIHVQVTN